MATLRIEAHWKKDGKEGKTVATVPFEDGKHNLPKEFPFDSNVYLGPDYGYSLDWIAIEKEKMVLNFAYADTVKLDKDGKGYWKSNSKRLEGLEIFFSIE